jgi:hypothetical protein
MCYLADFCVISKHTLKPSAKNVPPGTMHKTIFFSNKNKYIILQVLGYRLPQQSTIQACYLLFKKYLLYP